MHRFHTHAALHRVVLPVTLGLIAALAACSPPDQGLQTRAPAAQPNATDQQGGQATGGAATAAATQGNTGGEEETEVVDVQDFQFQPDTLTVPVGTTVVFQNSDSAPHTATHGEDGAPADDAAFDINLEPGRSGEFTFSETGTYPTTCRIHPEMNMTITVEE